MQEPMCRAMQTDKVVVGWGRLLGSPKVWALGALEGLSHGDN